MATPIEHNVRIIHLMTGEHIICNFTQIREEDKFVAYQMLYPLTLTPVSYTHLRAHET